MKWTSGLFGPSPVCHPRPVRVKIELYCSPTQVLGQAKCEGKNEEDVLVALDESSDTRLCYLRCFVAGCAAEKADIVFNTLFMG